MKILIVGGGKPLYFVCRSLLAKGHEVVVINRDRNECDRLAQQVNAGVVYGDASDPRVLEDAGVRAAGAVLAITPNDQDNLVICQLAGRAYGVPRTVALANDPDNVEVFRRLDIGAACTTELIGNLVEQRVLTADVQNLIPVAEGRVNLTEVTLHEDSPAVGLTMREVALPEGALIAVLIRDDDVLVPRGDTRLAAGDRAVVISLPDNHAEVLRRIMGARA
jgi:trk system potassium uptake protein TrkA